MKLNAVLLVSRRWAEAWDYLERICGVMPGLGVVVCTRRSTVAQRVRGLRLGADDWITKPCHPEEVMARSRRVGTPPSPSRPATEAGPFVAASSRSGPTVPGLRRGRPRPDPARVRVAAAACRTARPVLEREDIYQRVWGYAMAHGDRSVDVFMRKLRSKLGGCSPGWGYIHTHFGVGYRMDAGALVQEDPGVSESPAGAPSHPPQVPESTLSFPLSQLFHSLVTGGNRGAVGSCEPAPRGEQTRRR